MNINDYEFIFPSSVLFLGKSSSGKTTLMKNLLFKYSKKFCRIYVYCPIYNDDYNFMEERFVLRDADKLNLLIDAQYKLKEMNMQKDILIILDDWIGSCDIRHNTIFHKLATCGRHAWITTFYISQFLNQIPPVIRDNINYMLILNISKQSLDSINDYQDCYDKKEFFNFYKEVTNKQYNGLLLDNKKPYLKFSNGRLANVIPFNFKVAKEMKITQGNYEVVLD